MDEIFESGRKEISLKNEFEVRRILQKEYVRNYFAKIFKKNC
jgi:hypothetical protein